MAVLLALVFALALRELSATARMMTTAPATTATSSNEMRPKNGSKDDRQSGA